MLLTETQHPLSLFRGAGLLPVMGICFALRKNSSEMTCPSCHLHPACRTGPPASDHVLCRHSPEPLCRPHAGHVPSGGRLVAAIHGTAAQHFPSVTGATPTVRRSSSVPGPGRWPGAGVPRTPGTSALAVSGRTDTAPQTLFPREEWCRGNGLQQNFFCKCISSSKTKSLLAGPSRGFCVMVTKQMQSPAGHRADFISRRPPRFRLASGPLGQLETEQPALQPRLRARPHHLPSITGKVAPTGTCPSPGSGWRCSRIALFLLN